MMSLLKPAALLALCVLVAPAPPAAAARGHAMVVAIQHDAADAGLAAMRQGGNAVDAAVATGFALAVTFPQAGNLGGGGFLLFRDRNGATHFLDFRERAPMAATAGMYLDAAGNVVPGLSTKGYQAIGVPGSVAGLVYAQRHFGKLTLRQNMAAAIKLARDGFVLTEEEARNLQGKDFTAFPETRHNLERDGDFYRGGERFRQPELAATLERIASNPDTFYRGAMARQLAADVQSHGGLLTEADLAAYKVADRTPLVGSFRAQGQAYDVITSPPPSSGGIVLLETLNILSGFDLPALGHDRSPAQMQVIVEAFRRAYFDRADYLGDPDYTTMPLRQMASPAYAAAWRTTIVPGKPTPSSGLERPAGFLPAPPALPARPEPTQTTHFSIVDAEGNAVAMTYTLNALFGCGATAHGLGFVLNDEMDDFSAKPGSPNMFGLVQGPANAIGPGHRPLSSMTPTIVVTHARHPKLRLVLGSPGGSTITTTVANDLLSILVNGLTVQQAADAPRFHHQYLPDVVQVEKALPLDKVEALRQMGYQVSRVNEADEKNPGVWGDSELISVDPRTGKLEGADDARHRFGKVAAY